MINKPHLSSFFTTHKKIKALGERVKGRSYSAADFTKLIRRQFNTTDFIFKTYKDYGVEPDFVVVAGLYDCYDDANMLPSITISLCYHPDQENYFIDLLDWEQFSFDLAECIGHELVHRDQHLNGRKPSLQEYKSQKEPTSEQEYLGSEEEIEAYAFSIAAEMHSFNKPIHDCVMYGAYQETFASDTKIVLQLEKHVEQYKKTLEKIDEQIE